jgi:hypothetical protein
VTERDYQKVVFEITDMAKAEPYLCEMIKALCDECEYLPGLAVKEFSMFDDIPNMTSVM